MPSAIICPSCGAARSTLTTCCAFCGAETGRAKPVAVAGFVKQLAAELAGADMFSRPLIVQNFSVPDDKQAVLELLSMAVGNSAGYDSLAQAWRSKAQQLMIRAEVYGQDDPDYRRMVTAAVDMLRRQEEERQQSWRRVFWVAGFCFGGLLLLFGLIFGAIICAEVLKAMSHR